jgi:group I intron endonuclease
MTYGVVYLLTNLVNGKYYIGQTVNYATRMRQHSRSENKCAISRAIKKYGWHNFSREILGEADGKDSLDNLEKLWIIIANSIETGYNLEAGGANGKPCAETRLRQAAAKTGKKQFPETIERRIAPLRGRVRPQHVREALMNSLIGRVVPEELRARIANKLKGNIISPEQRERISNSLKGRVRSASHSRKLSESLQGHSVSQATRDKISATKRRSSNAHTSS